MDTEFVSWPLPVTVRVNVGFQSLLLVVHDNVVPLQADPLSLLNVRHCKHRTVLIFDFDWLADIQDVIRHIIRHLFGLDFFVGTLKRAKILQNALSCRVGWQIPQDHADPTLFTEAASVVSKTKLNRLLRLVEGTLSTTRFEKSIDVIERAWIVELH